MTKDRDGYERMLRCLDYIDSEIAPGLTARVGELLRRLADADSPDCLMAAITMVLLSCADAATLTAVITDAWCCTQGAAYRRALMDLGLDIHTATEIMLDAGEEMHRSIRDRIGDIDTA